MALEGAEIDGQILKASYGTTKYCINFLKNSVCHNSECIYLHHYEGPNNILSRSEMKNNKMLFEKQLIMAIEESKIFLPEKRMILEKNKNKKTIFPNPYTVYKKGLVLSYLGKKENIHKKKIQNKKPKMNLDIIFKYREMSRFNFVKEEKDLFKYRIEIPSALTSFISRYFILIENSNKQKGINYRLIDNNWEYLQEHLKVILQKELANRERKSE